MNRIQQRQPASHLSGPGKSLQGTRFRSPIMLALLLAFFAGCNDLATKDQVAQLKDSSGGKAAISDITTEANSNGKLSFTAPLQQGKCSDYVTATFDNSDLVKEIIISGSAPSCTIEIAHFPDKVGTATISIFVLDGTNQKLLIGSFKEQVVASTNPGKIKNNDTISARVSNLDTDEIANTSSPEPDPITVPAFAEDAEAMVSLSYSKAGRPLASSCAIESPTNVTVTTPCSCDALGDCTVGVTGTGEYFGPASFSYTLIANEVKSTPAIATLTITAVDDAPSASSITPAAFNEDTAAIITLSYTDVESDKGTSCAVSGPSYVTVTTPCACDSTGVCTVGVTGTANFNGAANLSYTVTANGAISNTATATLAITGIDDPPVATNTTPAAFNEDAATIVTLSYSDIDGDKGTACTISALSQISVSTPCACDSAGICTVGVTGAANYNGAASFSYSVTANGAASNTATATLSITAVDDAPAASNITPSAFNEDTAATINLSYADVESDKGTACAISGPSYVTVTTPCACDIAGVCTVGVTGTANFNGAAGFSYTVTANGAISNTATATLAITAVNDAPTDISLSSSSIAEHLVANSVVGTFSTTDVDSSTFTYSLVTGTGDTDNASFNMSGSSLRATNTLDYEIKSTYAIRVQVSDGSLTFEKPLTITVIDTADPATGIACGSAFCIELRTDRTIWAWGAGSNGQLGDGNFVRSSTPIRVGTDTTWMRIATGWFHALAIKADGTLWAWGFNSQSRLGLGDTVTRVVPTQVGTGTTWKEVVGHQNFSIAIQTDGTLWGWGGNGSYNLGLGDTTTRTTPTQIGTATNWSSLAAGSSALFALALKSDGTLWGWGSNGSGHVGTNGTSNVTTPTQIGTATWASIAVGNTHSLGIQTDGTLWTWGNPANGRLGNNSTSGNVTTPTKIGTATDWISVAAAVMSSFAIKGSGGTRALYAWGYNASGQVGDGTTTDVLVPKQIDADTTWQKLAAGDSMAFGQKADGSLWAWGLNSSGEQGNGASIYRATPSQIGSNNTWASACAGGSSTLALKTDGTLWSWGNNANGQLGQGNTTSLSTPTQVGTLTTWSKISCGANHVLAIDTDGKLWAWGLNNYGKLGDGTATQRTSPVPIAAPTTWAAVSATQTYSMGIRTDGTLWAWGYNYHGQLGDGSTTNRTTGPVPIAAPATWSAVSASVSSYGQINGYHTLAIKSDGTLWAWGYNYYGQLGDGTTTQQLSPVLISADTNWASAMARGTSSFARKTDGTLWAWGDNRQSQLGLGDATSRSAPTQIGTDTDWTGIAGEHFAGKSDGSLWGWGSTDAGILGITSNLLNTPTQILSSSTYTVLSSSAAHTVAIKADGTLWTWGASESGQLGLGETPPPSTILVPTQVRAP
jgi:alpha-tubulin suppressor-like RCC1 family protein